MCYFCVIQKNNNMLKRIFGFILISFSLAGTSQGIVFDTVSWADAIIKAQTENKLIFVDAYTTWCGPCKAMSANVFTLKEAGDFYNANFINIKMDMEKPAGRTFGQKYPVSAYPTLMFINGEGELVRKHVGGRDIIGLLQIGEDALKVGVNTKALDEKYTAGSRDYDFMYKYLTALSKSGKPTSKIMNEYLDSKPNISNKQMAMLVYAASSEADSRIFEQMEQLKAIIIAEVGQEAYNLKVKSACKATVGKAIQLELASLVEEAVGKANQNLSTGAKEFEYESRLGYAKANKDKATYMKYASDYASSVVKSNPKLVQDLINDMCQTFSADKEVYTKAGKIAKELYEVQDNFNNLMVYSYLLTTTGNSKEALKLAEKAKSKLNKTDETGLANHDMLIEKIKTYKGE